VLEQIGACWGITTRTNLYFLIFSLISHIIKNLCLSWVTLMRITPGADVTMRTLLVEFWLMPLKNTICFTMIKFLLFCFSRDLLLILRWRSVIDLTLASSNLAPFCYSSTGNDSLGSDYLPVSTLIGGTCSKKNSFVYKSK